LAAINPQAVASKNVRAGEMDVASTSSPSITRVVIIFSNMETNVS
jgi:hypothetical protein